MTETIEARALRWFVYGEVGSSSRTIATYMLYGTGEGRHPSDCGDLGRCIKLLDAIPEWRARLPEMASMSPSWAALVAHWDKLDALYRKVEANPVAGLKAWRACSLRIRRILKPVWDEERQRLAAEYIARRQSQNEAV